jgi:hypothetical protein
MERACPDFSGGWGEVTECRQRFHILFRTTINPKLISPDNISGIYFKPIHLARDNSKSLPTYKIIPFTALYHSPA